MTTPTASRTGPRDIAAGLGLAALMGCFLFLVWLGLSGELGRVLSGAVQAEAPAGDTATSTVQWGLALAVTAAVMVAPVNWKLTRSAGDRKLAAAALVSCVGAGVLSESAPAWAAVAMPAAVASSAYLAVALIRSRQEPLRRGDAAPLPQLSWSVAMAAAYGVLATLALLA